MKMLFKGGRPSKVDGRCCVANVAADEDYVQDTLYMFEDTATAHLPMQSTILRR